MKWTSILVRTALVLAIMVLVVQVYYIYQLQNDFAVARAAISTAAASETRASEGEVNGETGQPMLDERHTLNQADEGTEEPRQSVFLHKATSENIVANSTYIDHPITNGNPDAVLSVTHSWNPGGGPGIYNDHPIGVWYDASRKKWAIYNEDRWAMPENVCFNVAALRGPTETE